eukprot:Rhum_TRINITY_DN14309_c30_g1::Rhum_TRINITY_DN14309_c30_g1_i1::g.81124::m.81124
MDPSFDLPITRAVHYGGPTARPEEKPRPQEPRTHQPPIVMPCMSLDLSALLQAKATPYQQIAQGWDEARAEEEAAERAAHGFPPLPEGEAKVQFPADDNFWRCLQRLVKMIPGAQEKPAYAIEARSKTDVLTVNKDFLALFRVAWANEFPVELTVCLNETGKPQVAVFSVNATVWHEILLHSNGYAPLEHSQRAIPKGFVLCTSTADEGGDGAQRPLSLTIDAWRGVCDVWPEQTPNPEDLAKFSPEGDRPPQGRLFSPRQTGPSALSRIVMPDARSAALLAAAAPPAAGARRTAQGAESEGDRQRQLLADLPSSKQFASTSTAADTAVAAAAAALRGGGPPTPQEESGRTTASSAFEGPPQPSVQSTEQPRQRLQPGSEELPVEAGRLAADDVGGRVAGAGYDSDEEASVATSSLFSDASSSAAGTEPTAAAAAAAALKAAGFLNDSELPPTRVAARGVDETLHARVLAIEAAQIREDLEKEQTTVQKEQAMTIARLEAQVLRLQAGEQQQQQQQEPSMLPSAGAVQKQKQLSTYASGFSSIPTTYEATSYASYRTGGGTAAAATGGRGGGGGADAVWDDSRAPAAAGAASRLHHHQNHYPLQQQQQPHHQQQQPAYHHPQQYQESNASRHGDGLHLHRSAGVDTLTTLQDSLPVHITAPERGAPRHGGAAAHDADGDDGGLDDQLPDYVECGPPQPQHASAAGGGGNPQEQLRAFASDVRRLMEGGAPAAAAASRSGTQASSIQRATLSVPVGGGKSAPSLHHDVDPRHLAELVSIPSTSDYVQQPMQNTLVTNAAGGGGAATATNTASAATGGGGGATLEIQSESGVRTSLRVPGSVLQSLLRAASAHEEYAAEPDEYPGSPDAAGQAGQAAAAVPAAPVSSKLPLSTAPSFPFADDSTALRSVQQPILSTPGQQQQQQAPQQLRHAHAPTGLQAPTQQHPPATQQRAVARPLPPLPDPHYPPATAAAAASAAPPLLARPPVPATPLRAAAAPPSYGRPTPATTTATTHQHPHRTPVVDHRRLSPRRGTPSAAASADGLHNPISVCSSDAGHIIVHGPNGAQHFDLGHAAATGFVDAVRGAQTGAPPPALGGGPFSPRDVNTFRRPPPPPMHGPPSCSGASERSVWNRSGTADTDFASVTTSLPSMPDDTFLDGCPTQASQQTAAQQQQQQQQQQQ